MRKTSNSGKNRKEALESIRWTLWYIMTKIDRVQNANYIVFLFLGMLISCSFVFSRDRGTFLVSLKLKWIKESCINKSIIITEKEKNISSFSRHNCALLKYILWFRLVQANYDGLAIPSHRVTQNTPDFIWMSISFFGRFYFK